MKNLKITVKYGCLTFYNNKIYIILISDLYSSIRDKRSIILRDDDQRPFLIIYPRSINMIK
jgi:hypothetical protein